jgi:hypothetical protein
MVDASSEKVAVSKAPAARFGIVQRNPKLWLPPGGRSR